MTGWSDKVAEISYFSVGSACIGFSLKQTYISDNLCLYVSPSDRFCRTCFLRRYLSQMMQSVHTSRLGPSVIELARSLDKSIVDDNLWHVYAVKEKAHVISFELVPYEDCPACAVPLEESKEKATLEYVKRLHEELKPDDDGLKKRVFSFGFARQLTVTRNIGLADVSYNELMADNFAAKIYFRVIDSSGNHEDASTLGVSKDEKIAEIKSIMEYLERYAFMLHVCRYPTMQSDKKIIEKYMSLFREPLTDSECKIVCDKASWALNLVTNEIEPVPLAFIYGVPGMRYIRPTSNGFGAHVDFREAMCRSILELIERDAFVRFWHDPGRAFSFMPSAKMQKDIDAILSILSRAVGNDQLTSRFFVLRSPTMIPVVMITASSEDFSAPPSLCFGCGAGFDLEQAIEGALREFRFNAINLVIGASLLDGFLTKSFSGKIEEIQDRFNLYSTPAPRKQLRFLDMKNPISDAIYENEMTPTMEKLVDRFERAGLDIYAIDCTPDCFREYNVYVTRAFSTGMYPLQFQQEDAFRLESSDLSAHSQLPHFFL